VAEDHTGWSGGSPPHHVLIAATDVGRNDLQDDPMVALALAQRQHWEVDGLDFHPTGSQVHDTTIACHRYFLLVAPSARSTLGGTLSYLN
jgi:hypothetical protein